MTITPAAAQTFRDIAITLVIVAGAIFACWAVRFWPGRDEDAG